SGATTGSRSPRTQLASSAARTRGAAAHYSCLVCPRKKALVDLKAHTYSALAGPAMDERRLCTALERSGQPLDSSRGGMVENETLASEERNGVLRLQMWQFVGYFVSL